MVVPVICRLGLWPIRSNVCRASSRPAGNVASSVRPVRASRDPVEPRRRAAHPVLTVSSTKDKCREGVHTEIKINALMHVYITCSEKQRHSACYVDVKSGWVNSLSRSQTRSQT